MDGCRFNFLKLEIGNHCAEGGRREEESGMCTIDHSTTTAITVQ